MSLRLLAAASRAGPYLLNVKVSPHENVSDGASRRAINEW
jgi:hypothetical protein